MSPPRVSLRHVALNIVDLAAAERFYVDVLGFQVEWRPDPDNVYLTSAGDNLALHRVAADKLGSGAGRLDHIGLMVARAEDVDTWAAWLRGHGVALAAEPKTHRDGARSLYTHAPDGTLVQIIHHPPIRLE